MADTELFHGTVPSIVKDEDTGESHTEDIKPLSTSVPDNATKTDAEEESSTEDQNIGTNTIHNHCAESKNFDEVEVCDEHGGSSESKPRAFEIDVTQIMSVAVDEQASEIQSLGLTVYDQTTLEKGIWDQVEEETRRREAEEQLAAVSAKLKLTEQQLERVDTGNAPPLKSLLRDALIKAVSKNTNVKAIEKHPEIRRKELQELRKKEAVLKAKLSTKTVVQGSPSEGECIESENERKIRMGEMTPFGTALSGGKSDLSGLEKYMKSQLELQKKMQNSSVLKKNKGIGHASAAKKSAKDTKNYKEKNYKGGGSSTGKHSSCHGPVLKKSILMPKKRHLKERLGTETSTSLVDQASSPGHVPGETVAVDLDEYIPSVSDYENLDDDDMGSGQDSSLTEDKSESKRNKAKRNKEGRVNKVPGKDEGGKKRKGKSEAERWAGGSLKRRKVKNTLPPSGDPDDWASDDSDWICTDDDGSSSGDDIIKRKKRLVKREVDDGNDEDFFRRVKQWERQNEGLREQMEEECHEFDNGYKIPLCLWAKLYKYQQVGVNWLWELHQQRCGGILGDEMGLGKTIQIISFLAGLSISGLKCRSTGYRGLGPTLVVCPTTVMHQWVREFHSWFPPLRVAILHDSGCFVGKRTQLIRNIANARGVLVTSYTAIVRLKDSLLNQRWHYIVLDEGHKIRNPDAQVTLVAKQLRTPHRIILSGSPMQNHLRELWSLMDFVFPGKLGTLPVFMQEFAVPITQGGYANASEVMVATAFKCATVLRDSIAPYLLRRMKSDVGEHIQLPAKSEQVLFCRLTDEQRELYKGYLDCGEVGRILEGRLQIFVGLINLRKICNHPHLYCGGPKLFAGEKEEDLPIEERFGFWKKAGKMLVIEALLKIWHRQQHRVLIFTQSRQMLLIIENFIRQQGYTYLKLDGGTSISARQPLINKFNQDSSYFLMLLTTKVGGLGVNLTGANRVVIYDPDWNPATDTQARERAWRIGQQNAVTVYRLITAGTIEEKMYHRQIFKQFLCNKVLKDPRQRRFFKSNDLTELFTLKETDSGGTETSAIFAGTGSQVHVSKGNQRERRKSHERVEEKISVKTRKRKSNESDKEDNITDIKATKISFSQDKVQDMKRLAQELSRKLASKVSASGIIEKNEKEEKCNNNAVIECEPKRPQAVEFITLSEAGSNEAQETPSEDATDCDLNNVGPECDSVSVLDTLDDDDELENMKQIAQELSRELTDKVQIAAAINVQRKVTSTITSASQILSDMDMSETVSHKLSKILEPTTTLTEDSASLDDTSKRARDSGFASDTEKIDGQCQSETFPDLSRGNMEQNPKDKMQLSMLDSSFSGSSDICVKKGEKLKGSYHSSVKHKKHKKHKKRHRERDIEFEGERVPYLVKSTPLQTKTTDEMREDASHAKQDDYVLRKLFAKTGLQTAMQHDKIMEGGDADYALVEGEARRVAQEAVKHLKASRQHCWSAASGVPTWTGSSGALRVQQTQGQPGESDIRANRSKPKFGSKKKSSLPQQRDESKQPEEAGSSGLLARIRARNLFSTEDDDNNDPLPGTHGDPDPNKELLDDIRTFVSFGASVDGRATTDEIVSQFRDRLPPQSSALFKQMLMQICEFHRLPSGMGVWKLIQEFQW